MTALASADLKETGGMFPIEWDTTTGKPKNRRLLERSSWACGIYSFSPGHLSVGAQADSAHEYLLKLYLLTGKTDKASLEMCMSVGHSLDFLLFIICY